jgi:hypothetical protein
MTGPIAMIKWMVDNWKPACAFIYTVICLFDFVVFPCWVGWHRMTLAEFIAITEGIDPSVKVVLQDYSFRPYSPYTLAGGGLFHLSFGAILTGVAFSARPTVITDRRHDTTSDKTPTQTQQG